MFTIRPEQFLEKKRKTVHHQGSVQPRKELSVAEAAVKDALRIFRESLGDVRVAVAVVAVAVAVAFSISVLLRFLELSLVHAEV